MESKVEEKKELSQPEEKKEEDEVDKEFKQIVAAFPEEVKARFVALKHIAVLFCSANFLLIT